MSIETIKSIAQSGINGIDALDGVGESRATGSATNVHGAHAPSFAETLGQALSAVEKTQTDADDQAAHVAMGGGNLHEMSLALEKADISMRLATKVRNKLLDAYNDIMRMGV